MTTKQLAEALQSWATIAPPEEPLFSIPDGRRETDCRTTVTHDCGTNVYPRDILDLLATTSYASQNPPPR